MNFRIVAPTALEYFASLVQSDNGFPLLESAISLAHDEYPEMDIQEVLGQVDQLVNRLKNRLSADAGAIQKLRVLNKFFFEEMGFSGNTNNYYDPDNSYLHVMLRTRRGIPISLAVLWLELATQIGIEAFGVGFPGHFLVIVYLPYPHDGKVVIDPFTGQSLSKDNLMERLEPIYAETGLSIDGAVTEEVLKHYLRNASPREIMARMLRNLEEVYTAQADTQRLSQVRKRLEVLLPSWDEEHNA